MKDFLLYKCTNKNSDSCADWLDEIGPAHGECMRAATERNPVLHTYMQVVQPNSITCILQTHILLNIFRNIFTW